MQPLYNLYWPSNTRLSDLGDHNVDLSWSKSNWVLLLPGFHESSNGFQFSDDRISLFNVNNPWDVHNIKIGSGNINRILWNPSGSSFITITSRSILTFWEKEHNLINKWEKSTEIELCKNDEIVHVSWIDEELLSVDSDNAIKTVDYLQRYSVSKNKLFNNTSKENSNGLIIITASGRLKVLILDEEVEKGYKIIESQLSSITINIQRIDAFVNDNGKLFVAAQTGPSTIELFTVGFKEINNVLSPYVETWPCIVPHMNQTQSQNFEIKDVKVVSFNSVDYTIVNSKGSSISLVQIFEIKKEQVVLHHVFPRQQQNQQQSDMAVCLKQLQFSSDIISMNVGSIIYTNFSSNTNRLMMPKLVIIDSTNTLYIFSLVDYTQLIKLDNLNFAGELLACKLSPCEQSVILITNENTSLFTIPYYMQSQDSMSLLPLLLGYSMNTSIIPWDILSLISSLDTQQIETFSQVFTQEFNEQTLSLQQLLFKSYCNIKSLFYQILNNGCGILCCNNLLLLRQIYSYFSSVVVTENDTKIIEGIKKVCSSKKDVDLNKLVQHIDMKETTLASFLDPSNRQLIQWFTDFTIFIIRNILSCHHGGQNWRNILKYFDTTSILKLRELLLLFYILYQKNPTLLHISPIFVNLTSPIDMIVKLVKFLTKFHLILSGDTNADIIVNDLPLNNLPLMYLEISYHRQQTIFSLNKRNELNEYEIQTKDEVWDYIQQISLRNPLSSGVSTINMSARQIFDGINLTYASLMNDEEVKKCCNCNTLTIHTAHNTRTFNANWKDSFKANCFCDGMWQKIKWNP